MNTIKEQCCRLKSENPSWGYQKIADVIGCSKNTVRFHLDPAARDNAKQRVRKSRALCPLRNKLRAFGVIQSLRSRVKNLNRDSSAQTTIDELISLITSAPKCYLTGRTIDLTSPRSYQIDHKIPKSKGGDNSIANLGLTCREANYAKGDLNLEELLNLCIDILRHHGFSVEKKS